MKQKILILGIVLILLISGLNGSAQMQTPTALSLNYDLTKVDKPLKAGDSGTLIVVIQNKGGLPAEEVKVSILRTTGLIASDLWNLGTINPGELITLETRIRVADDAKPGTYTIPLKLEFRSQSYGFMGALKTEDEESEWKIIVRVYGEANFEVTPEKQEFYKDVANDLVLKGTVKQEVRNVYATLYATPILESTASSMDVSATSASLGASAERTGSKCISIIGSEKIYLGNLDANQNFVLDYTIKPNAVGICSVSVNFDYEDASGTSSSETESFGLDIKRSNVDIKVSGITHPLLNPGDTAEVSIALKNVGSADASDATAILGLTMEDISKIPPELIAQMSLDYPFVVVGSSEKYIKNFAGGETKEVSFKIRINNDAKTKAYEIPLKIKYFDSAGTDHEISKVVGVEVRGKPEIEVMIKESEITKNKNIGKITVEILNKGSSDAQFFNVKILSKEQYVVLSSGKEYIGSLESDDSENVDFDIKVHNTKNVDTVPVSLSIEYKDNYNNEYKEDLEVDLNLFSDNDLGNGSSIFMTIIILLVVVVLGYLIYRKFIK